jgi:TRAP-type C4-dicarboxylate transport system permease small subunit
MDAQQQAVGEAVKFVTKFNQVFLYPLIALLTAVAFFIFLYGCAKYIINAGNDSARAEGVKHITFGIIGLVIMMTAWAILQIATATFGLSDELNCANNPSAAGCERKFSI